MLQAYMHLETILVRLDRQFVPKKAEEFMTMLPM